MAHGHENNTLASTESTMKGAEDATSALGEAVPALTILYHPDLTRVGEVALLSDLAPGRSTELSRVAPPFGKRDAREAHALADRFLSRNPVRLERSDDTYSVVAGAEGNTVVVDGNPVVGSVTVPASDLEHGVVLELGGRVVLLLHTVDPMLFLRRRRPSPPLGLVGESDAIERVREDIRRVADLDVSVLIRGETGTGKELVARAIHDVSRRRTGPCMCVNMSTLTDTVAAAELFGHARGAFTGAIRDAPGYFVRAHGGTLFLDEVGATPAAVQAMLLRVLETREVQPVGATTHRLVDVRVLAATDALLEADVHNGRFGAALLHRLAGYEIVQAPLRHRRDDIGRLFVHFLREELAALGESKHLEGAVDTAQPYVPPSLVARLARHDWPGNVRQLRNVVRQIVIGSRGAPRLQGGVAVERLFGTDVPSAPPLAPTPVSRPVRSPAEPKRKPSQITDDELVAALRANHWKRDPAARQLGIAASSLYLLIDRCPLIRKSGDLSRDELERCRTDYDGNVDRMAEHLEVSSHGLQLRMRELGLV